MADLKPIGPPNFSRNVGGDRYSCGDAAEAVAQRDGVALRR